MLFQFFFKENQARSQAKIPEGAKPSPQDRATTMTRFYTLTFIGCKAKRQTVQMSPQRVQLHPVHRPGYGLRKMRQWVTECTRGDNTLDLVFSRRMSAVACVRDGLFDSDHRELVVDLIVPGNKAPLVTRTRAFDYKRADFPGLRRSLSLAPWGMLDGIGVNEAAERFYDLLNAATFRQ